MAKICSKEGCNNPVFSKGFCKWHIPKKAIKSSGIKKKSKSYIKSISDKRKSDNEKYKKAKINVRKKLQEENNWRCFFSNIDLPDEFDEFHHLMDKENKKLYDENNIMPAIRKYHNDYHHKTISYLLKQKWYIDFLTRVQITYPEVFEKESRRITKKFK